MAASANNEERIVGFTDPQVFHDCVLVVGDKKFYVLSDVLSAHAEYFRPLLNGTSETAKKEIVLKDVDPKAFEIFLDLVYMGIDDFMRAPLLTAVLEMSVLLMAPTVTKMCEDYIFKNFDELDNLKLELLKTACKCNINSLKFKLQKHFKNPGVMNNFNFDEVFECAIKYKLPDLKEWLGKYKSETLTAENCGKLLGFATEFELISLETGIIAKVATWDKESIPEDRIIDLVKSAFKNNIAPLKAKLRERIFYLTKTKKYIIDGNPKYFTVNAFLAKYHKEIYDLPNETREFIVTSTFISK